jgi:8-oxo-dGTP diphosphatase
MFRFLSGLGQEFADVMKNLNPIEQARQQGRREGIVNTVDVLVVCQGEVVVERRAYPPFEDKLVLPGGHVDTAGGPHGYGDRTLAEAAVRELQEETGLTVSPAELKLLTVLDEPGRDPRGRYVSTVFYVQLRQPLSELHLLAASDAKAVLTVPISELTADNMGFDHIKAVDTYRLRG